MQDTAFDPAAIAVLREVLELPPRMAPGLI